MRNRNKNIFSSPDKDRKQKQNLSNIKDIARDSGYLHDWNRQRRIKQNDLLKKLAIFGAAVIVTVGITIFINMQNLRQIREERERFLAEMTPVPTQIVETFTPAPVVYSEKFDFAQIQYKDVVGYLTITDTNMDFPIVQGEDNYFYENRNYDRSYSSIAATYMLAECDVYTSRHLVIYGENEEIDGRLGELDKFLDYDFFHTHEFITLELLDGAQTWQVFSVHLANIDFNYKDIYFESNTEFLAYIQMFKTMSRFERQLELSEKDQIVTLVTDYHDLDLDEGYLMIHARRIS